MRTGLGLHVPHYPSGGFAPTDISGLVAWYDASNAASITHVAGAVSQWNDLSGNGYHLKQGTGSLQPTTGTTLNGLNSITFNGDGLDTDAFAPVALTDLTLAVCLNNTSSSHSIGEITGKAQYITYGDSNQAHTMYGWTGAPNVGINDAALGSGETFLLLIRCKSAATAGSTMNIYTAGGDALTGSSNGAVSSSDVTHIRVGRDFVGARYIIGQVGEFVLYNSNVTGADLTALGAYLERWGVVYP